MDELFAKYFGVPFTGSGDPNEPVSRKPMMGLALGLYSRATNNASTKNRIKANKMTHARYNRSRRQRYGG